MRLRVAVTVTAALLMPRSLAAQEPEEWIATVHAATRPAVAQVSSRGEHGAGFLFHSRRHVATAFHVVASDRPIRVQFPEGRAFRAEVVAVDEVRDIAILELSRPVRGVAPLQTGGAVSVGMPIVAIGHPYVAGSGAEEEEVLSWSVTRGIVSGRTDELLLTDAAVHPGDSGAPLVDPRGRVVGLLTARGDGLGIAVPVSHLEILAAGIGPDESFGRPPLVQVGVGWLVHGARGTPLVDGLYLGAGLVLLDRVGLGARVSLPGRDDQPAGSEVYLRATVRSMAEVEASYRFLVAAAPVYAVPTIGLLLGKEDTVEELLTAAPADPDCDPTVERCVLRIARDRRERGRSLVGPVAGLRLQVAYLEVGYALHAPRVDLDALVHRFFVGIIAPQ